MRDQGPLAFSAKSHAAGSNVLVCCLGHLLAGSRCVVPSLLINCELEVARCMHHLSCTEYFDALSEVGKVNRCASKFSRWRRLLMGIPKVIGSTQ